MKAYWEFVAKTDRGLSVWSTLAKNDAHERPYKTIYQITAGDEPKNEAGYYCLPALLRLKNDQISLSPF